MKSTTNENSPLSGYRILDLSDDKGLFCSRLLADIGAKVIRIDRPETRLSQKQVVEINNLGKQSLTLNLEIEAGREIFRRLIETADVVVESYPPGYLDKLGLGYRSLAEINPRLIMAAITPFGQNGPYRDYHADDIVAAALGGQLFINGEPGLPPLKPYGNQNLAGLTTANGIMLALWQRHSSGRGQYIDISLQECAAANLDHTMVRYFYRREVAQRQGGLYWNNAFRIFACRDGYILLSLFQQWETLVEWLADEGMAGDLTDDKWRDGERRIEQIEDIITILEKWTKSHNVTELVEKGQLMHFPWAGVLSIDEVSRNPQLAAREFWIEVEHPESGRKYKLPGTAAKLSNSPWKVGNYSPIPGENNKEIYHQELGLSEKELETLTKEGIL